MNNPGPIKKIAQTIKSNAQSRKDEKQRAADQGYKYNRNEVHDAGEGKVRNLKGSVGAVIKQEASQAKQNVKAKVGAVKQAAEKKVTAYQKSREAKKAMKASDERGKNSRIEGKGKERVEYLANIGANGKISQADGGKFYSNSKSSSKKGKVAGKNVIQKAKNSIKLKQAQIRSRKSGIK